MSQEKQIPVINRHLLINLLFYHNTLADATIAGIEKWNKPRLLIRCQKSAALIPKKAEAKKTRFWSLPKGFSFVLKPPLNAHRCLMPMKTKNAMKESSCYDNRKEMKARRDQEIKRRFDELYNLRFEGTLRLSFESIIEKLSAEYFLSTITIKRILKKSWLSKTGLCR